jgi:hypothetical protein
MLAQIYSSSELSFDSDRLITFQGILAALEKGFDEKFFWAIPVSYIEQALAWTSEIKLRRNEATHSLKQSDGTATAVPFPSWPWVGWIGRNPLETF